MFLIFNILILVAPQQEKDSIKINRIRDCWFSEDKFQHFIHSAGISSTAYLLSNKLYGINNKNSIYISISLGTISGFAKEIIDKKSTSSHFSFKDIIYDIAGVAVGILLVSAGDSDG